MKNLKIQAWDEKRKKMFQVESGYLPEGITDPNDFFMGFNYEGFIVREHEGKGHWRDLPTRLYTNKNDYKGKEVYEGDIINFYHSQGKEMSAFKSVVEYKQEWCGFYFEDNLRLNYRMKVEVIGNIYENPEMLEFQAMCKQDLFPSWCQQNRSFRENLNYFFIKDFVNGDEVYICKYSSLKTPATISKTLFEKHFDII
jgi:uncharacterized phage protein (TIGR01671 family)